MSAGKSANKHLALETWKINMQDILMAINQMERNYFNRSMRFITDPDAIKKIRIGTLAHLDDCQSFSEARIVNPPYVTESGVYVKRNCGYCIVDYGDVSAQEYIKQYYTGDENRSIGEIL